MSDKSFWYLKLHVNSGGTRSILEVGPFQLQSMAEQYSDLLTDTRRGERSMMQMGVESIAVVEGKGECSLYPQNHPGFFGKLIGMV